MATALDWLMPGEKTEILHKVPIFSIFDLSMDWNTKSEILALDLLTHLHRCTEEGSRNKTMAYKITPESTRITNKIKGRNTDNQKIVFIILIFSFALSIIIFFLILRRDNAKKRI